MSCLPTLARRWQRSSGVSGLLLESAQAHPGLPFLEDRFGHAMTDAETAGQVRAFAGFLRRSGLKRGDRFAILASNRAEVAVAVFATALAGGIFTILNPKLRPKGLAAILGQAEPFLIVVDPTTAATLEEVGGGGANLLVIGEAGWSEALSEDAFEKDWNGCDPDPVCLVFTSGSTGSPRGVTLSHDNLSYVVARNCADSFPGLRSS